MKTIWEASCSLAKEIMKLEFTNDFRELYSSFVVANGEERGKFFYKQYADGKSNQAYGYLEAVNRRDEINNSGNFFFPELSADEILLLKKVHCFLFELNRKIINRYFGLNTIMKEAIRAYSSNMLNTGEDVLGSYDNSIYNEVLDAFKDCNSIRNIRTAEAVSVEGMNLAIKKGAINKILKDINSICPWESKQEYNILTMQSQLNTDEAKLKKGIFSVAVLKEQIRVLNQLLYQAFLSDKLVCFGEDHIFDIKHHTSTCIGKSMQIFVQSTSILPTDCGNIVLVKIPGDSETKKAFITGSKMSFSQESGRYESFDMRIINNDMNPFVNLI